MAENKNTIVLNDRELAIDDLTDSQKLMVNHIADLDRKIGTTQFNLDQLNVGRAAFVQHLTASLESEENTEKAA